MWPETFGMSSREFYDNIVKFNSILSPNELREYKEKEEDNDITDLNKYIKIVYESDPIGERRIVLQLTSFDLEAYERDKNRKTIPTKEVGYCVREPEILYYDNDKYQILFDRITEIVDEHYMNEINKLRSYIETSRIIKPVATTYDERKIIKGNITNSDNIVCDVIEGNVVNCDNVKVREIRGNTVNCEIYKEG